MHKGTTTQDPKRQKTELDEEQTLKKIESLSMSDGDEGNMEVDIEKKRKREESVKINMRLVIGNLIGNEILISESYQILSSLL